MTRSIRVSEDLVPIGKFRAETAKILRASARSSQPLIITQNGEAAGVVVSPKEFDRIRERQALLEDIATGRGQIENGDGLSTAEVRKELRAARRRRKKSG